MLRVDEEKPAVVFFVKNLGNTDIIESNKLRHIEVTPTIARSAIGADIKDSDHVTAVMFNDSTPDLVSQSRWKLDRMLDQLCLENEMRINRPSIIDEVLDYRPVGLSYVNRHTINKGWSESVRHFKTHRHAFQKNRRAISYCLQAKNKAPQLRRSIGQSIRLFRMANEASDHVVSFIFYYCALEVLISGGELYGKKLKLVERLQAIHPTKNHAFIKKTAHGIYRARGDLLHAGIFFDGVKNRRKEKPFQEYMKWTRHFYLNCLDAMISHAYNEKTIEMAWVKLEGKALQYSIKPDRNTTVSYRRWTAVQFLKHSEALSRLNAVVGKLTRPSPAGSP